MDALRNELFTPDFVCHFQDGKLSEAWIVDVDPYELDEFFG